MSTHVLHKMLVYLLIVVVGFTLGTATRAWWDDTWDSITIVGNR